MPPAADAPPGAWRRAARAFARGPWPLLCLVLLGGAARFWNPGWDGGAGDLHPDEWALNGVVRRLGPDLNPHFFFYGTFPIYLDRLTAEVLRLLTGIDWLPPERLPLIGRFYSALESTALVPLVFLVGRRLWGRGSGLLAAACTAGAGLLIQAAHFGTVDTAVALAGMLLLWCALRIADGAGPRVYLLSGVLLGLALATKLTAASFLLLPALGHLLRARPPGAGRPSIRAWRDPLLLVAAAAATTLLAAPYYLLAWPEFRQAILDQTAELSGGYQLAYTWQFIGSRPYLFEVRNLVVWGLGVPLGVAALAGWGWALLQAAWQGAAWVRRLADGVLRRPVRGPAAGPLPPGRGMPAAAFHPPGLVFLLVVWPVLYLGYIGTWEARFIRHLLPLVPFCALFAAGGIAALAGWPGRRAAAARRLAVAISVLTAVGAGAWGLAVLAIYTAPDTRVAATAWIAANVPPGATLLIEDKNTLIPLPDRAHPQSPYPVRVLPVLAPDTPAKMGEYAAALAASDVLVVPNRRWSAVLPRLPSFPRTGQYYRLLFGGALGYTSLATFAAPPRLGPLSFSDDSAEETFQVFDHPTVRLFRNTGRLPEPALRALLGAQ